MITCVIIHDIDPDRREPFAQYARRRGADLVGCFAPHEGSTSTAHGISSRPPLAGHEASRARPAAGPPGRETCEFAKRDGFLRRESRLFVKSASARQGDRA